MAERILWRRWLSPFAVTMLLALLSIFTGCTSSPPQQRLAPTTTDVPAILNFFAAPTISAALTSTPSLPTEIPLPTATPPFVGGPIPIGYSVQQRPIMAYRLGYGPIERALIGGLHGGYEWNTVALMTQTLEYLIANPEMIPAQITLHIIPVANPDGLAAGTDRVRGRMNAHQVDLNRNWGYHWQMTATHGIWPVFAGRGPFSEPETLALRAFIVEREMNAVVFYHSAFAAVFSGAGTTTSHTVELARVLAEATGYRYAPEGVPGQITTGDAIDWLTAKGITAVEVELTTHHDIDWEQNQRGLRAFLTWNLLRRQSVIEDAK